MPKRRQHKDNWPSWVNSKAKRAREEAERIALFWQDAQDKGEVLALIRDAANYAQQLLREKFPDLPNWGYRIDLVMALCPNNPRRVACYVRDNSDGSFAHIKIYWPRIVVHDVGMLTPILLHEFAHHILFQYWWNGIPVEFRWDGEGLANAIVQCCGYSPKWEDGTWFSRTPPNELFGLLNLTYTDD